MGCTKEVWAAYGRFGRVRGVLAAWELRDGLMDCMMGL